MMEVVFYRRVNMVYGLLQCMMEVVFYRRIWYMDCYNVLRKWCFTEEIIINYGIWILLQCIVEVVFYGRFCFVALRPKSTAMVIAGRSVHLTTLFPGQA